MNSSGYKTWLIVAALLLVVGFTLFFRLNSAHLKQQITTYVHHIVGGQLHAEHISISLMRGFSVGLRHVQLANAQQHWTLSAKEMRMNLKLIPLLSGHIQVAKVVLVSPVFDIPSFASVKTILNHTPVFPVSEFQVRQGQVTIKGIPVFRHTALNIRELEGGNTLGIEWQAGIGQGSINIRSHLDQRTHKISGKLKMERIPLVSIKAIASFPAAYQQMDAALTFDSSAQKHWQLFGDMNLYAPSKDVLPVTLRGRLDGDGIQHIVWKEGFIRIGDDSVFSTQGGCKTDIGCTIRIDTHHAILHDLAQAATGRDIPVYGNVDGHGTLNGHAGVWTLDTDVSVQHPAWKDMQFSDTRAQINHLRFDRKRGIHLATATITQAEKTGKMVLEDTDATHSSLTLEGVKNWWQSIGNLALNLYHLPPVLAGSGIINGDIQLLSRNNQREFTFHLDASQADLSYTPQFHKPTGIPATANGKFRINHHIRSLWLDHAQLASSTLDQFKWQRSGATQAVEAQSFNINVSGLNAKAIHLPVEIKRWHGGIQGHLAQTTMQTRSSWQTWLADMNGTVGLTHFGRNKHIWTGDVNIHSGLLESKKLAWQNGTQQAIFDGTLNMAQHKGTVNLNKATLAWGLGQEIPAWFHQATLNGHIQADHLAWLDNDWHHLKVSYQTKGIQLTLKELSVNLAGGTLNAPKLSIISQSDGIAFSGRLRVGVMQLQKIHGLDKFLQTTPTGYLYMNSFLQGELPIRDFNAWQGNGDIEIQRGGWNGGKFQIYHGNTRSRIHKFSRAAAHFHLNKQGLALSALQIEAGNHIASGKTKVTTQGTLSGTLHIKNTQGRYISHLNGTWPDIHLTAPAP